LYYNQPGGFYRNLNIKAYAQKRVRLCSYNMTSLMDIEAPPLITTAGLTNIAGIVP
jgi:hypothetical protein